MSSEPFSTVDMIGAYEPSAFDELPFTRFEPLIQVVHDAIIRSVSLDDGESIISKALCERLESLGALAMAYSAGIVPSDCASACAVKADDYRRRFERAIRSARILIDTDGDGEADLWRSPGVSKLTR